MSTDPAEMSRRAFILATAVVAAGCIRTEPGGRVRLAAGDPGGLYLAFAEILAKQLQTRYPDVAVDVLPTEGTVENLARLRSADVDMGLALADVAERDRATGPAQTAPQAVARVYENYLQVIVRDSAAGAADWQTSRDCGSPSGRADPAARRPARCCSRRPVFAARMDMLRYRLQRRAGRGWPTAAWTHWCGRAACRHRPSPNWPPQLPLRMLDIGELAAPMSRLAGYPVRRAPSADRRVRATGHAFYRSARSAAVPPANIAPTWSLPSWTYLPPTHRNWCLPTFAVCSTSTRPR